MIRIYVSNTHEGFFFIMMVKYGVKLLKGTQSLCYNGLFSLLEIYKNAEKDVRMVTLKADTATAAWLLILVFRDDWLQYRNYVTRVGLADMDLTRSLNDIFCTDRPARDTLILSNTNGTLYMSTPSGFSSRDNCRYVANPGNPSPRTRDTLILSNTNGTLYMSTPSGFSSRDNCRYVANPGNPSPRRTLTFEENGDDNVSSIVQIFERKNISFGDCAISFSD
ncbi:hypothetical protein Bhyg_09383 [Pseudolycoriella hygida]|uniref:Uncharacterized protein n=1 Tax=Pseudolycoriella hygida TaxID=35572 RepID=A0A9Q0S4C8_9DIPT|nr:hypothetical protein Bhyg_09383 [Pseudolycoriella hygida]